MVARPIRVHALIDALGAGGAELLMAELADAAPRAGIELAVTALSAGPDRAGVDRLLARGVRPTAVPIRSIVSPVDLVRVRRAIQRVGADVVHTHMGNADLVAGAAARSLGVPSVSTVHADRWIADRRLRLKLDLMALARRRCAAEVIAVSESSRRAYLAEGWDRPDHVRVVHNGIAATPEPGAGAAVRRELGIDPGAVVVAMVTSLRAEKGFDVAVRAVAEARRTRPELHLLVVGGGPSERELAELAAAHPGTATLSGYRDDVMAVLDGSDLVIHPSRFDAFPTSVLEAMAASVPVVATAVGGIPEMVADGVSGVLVPGPPAPGPFATALAGLAADPDLRAALAAAARERFEAHFTAERWAARLREVYERLAFSSSQGPPIESAA